MYIYIQYYTYSYNDKIYFWNLGNVAVVSTLGSYACGLLLFFIYVLKILATIYNDGRWLMTTFSKNSLIFDEAVRIQVSNNFTLS